MNFDTLHLHLVVKIGVGSLLSQSLEEHPAVHNDLPVLEYQPGGWKFSPPRHVHDR